MKRMSRLRFLLAAAVTLCGTAVSTFAAETLHIYNWADYVSPDLVTRFEKENDCKVVIDTFDSNETMFAKIKAGGAGYDLIFPTSYMVKAMEQEGMLASIDKSQVPNLKNVDPEALTKVYDTKMAHSVPYTMGYAVIAYRKDKLKDVEPSWAVFARTDLKKRATLFDDMRETIGAALKQLGYSLNTRDEKQLAEARDLVIKWKKNIAKFDNEGYKAGLDSGEFILVQGYSGDLFQVAQENEKVAIAIPKEGVSIGCDQMVIPKNAPQPQLAHKFINFLLDAEVSAENMEWMGYLCPNKEGLKKVSEDFLKNPAVSIPDAIKAKSEVIEELGADLAKYTKVWDEIKAAK
ncbi:spermidine/putrescine transport system substrate-binding protein [Roseimicrobium gellanilyticum]|uniref:Spermidine/putrescine transport system substrate-binding protein n=2 Tax=Roseimicrobium gellanilyticum TaxID=748857 RepID=A0A366HEF5_9BACT|nr:spermidine/putrescine transport system substrate-binding protein [Roseimicrobium gellanilyticum]